MRMSYPRAPEFPQGLTWFNIAHPLRVSDELRGRVVILDFWTYCCINCLHVLPDLEYLEHKYAREPVAIIGVHSNKYANEASPENIRQAILRYNITHPVVVDADHRIWDAYTVHAWPTLAVIDTTGHVIGMLPGEGHRDELDALITTLLQIGRDEGTLAAGPLQYQPLQEPHPASGLLYPGKIIGDMSTGRLFITDSDHDRVLITDWHGAVQQIIGSGRQGNADGLFTDAQFHHPQGLALFDNTLYIADTDNHTVRRADLATSQVVTIAGTGEIGYDRRGGRRGTEQPLNSPWDLVVMEGLLYIAMAGLHQVWTYDPQSEATKHLIGTGRENIMDNPAERAALAQPSGLSTANAILYFADSETSAVRQYDPRTSRVDTLVGQGLFTFGDIDGPGDIALLQHPLGVAAQGDVVFVADTYNHKIRKIDLHSDLVSTVAGTGRPGRDADGTLELYEPGGLWVSGDDLFIADTNNHRIIHYHLDTGTWSEVTPKIGGQPLAEAA
ncbi:MAG: thioredoxin-like domain-containing protein [Armatimonadota bacterium]